jgi:hypothetical protein
MNTFYGKPEDILACRAKGAPLPAADDIEGWRNLYKDARDYAIDRINEAVERGDVSPDQIPMTEATAVEAAEKMDIDKVDEDKRADEFCFEPDRSRQRARRRRPDPILTPPSPAAWLNPAAGGLENDYELFRYH